MNPARNNTIPRLTDEIRRLADTDENRRRLSLFKMPHLGVDKLLPGPRKADFFPIIVHPEINLWANFLGFSLMDYYHDPLAYLEARLRITLAHWKEIQDDAPITKIISIRFGVALVPSLWGAKIVFAAGDNPWYVFENHFASSRELHERCRIDFEESGLMKRAFEFYEVMREVLPEDFEVEFPLWDFSPLGTADMLYGTENFLMQLISDPEDAHNTLSFVTEAQATWYKKRSEFIKKPLSEVTLGEDDVCSPMLSPQIYRDFILPTEMRLKEICGAISYWHSCGDTTPFFQDIAHLAPWLMDVSYVSDQKRALEVFPPSVAIECNVNGIAVLGGDFAGELEKARIANDLFADRCAYFTLAGLAPRRKPAEDLDTLKKFLALLNKRQWPKK